MGYDYDAIVLGDGGAGASAALTAADIGCRTVLIATHHPHNLQSKLRLLASAAEIAHSGRIADRMGIGTHIEDLDFERMMAAVHQRFEEITPAPGSHEFLRSHGVDIVIGQARFTDHHSIELTGEDGVRLSGRNLFVEGHFAPVIPDIPGLAESDFRLPPHAVEMRSLPRKLVILGAGSRGCEIAQIYGRLGSDVTVVESEPGILLGDDEELSSMVQETLEDEGIHFILSAVVTKVVSTGSGSVLEIEQGGAVKIVSADEIIVSCGEAVLFDGLGLQSVGVECSGGSIVVDDRSRTNVRSIYGIGAAIGRAGSRMQRHTANVAVLNAFGRSNARLNPRRQFWSTFTEPGLAHAGLTKDDLMQAGVNFEYMRMQCVHQSRSVVANRSASWLKILVSDGEERVLGVDYFDSMATDRISALSLAIAKGLALRDLWEVVEPMGRVSGQDSGAVREPGKLSLRRLFPVMGLLK